MATRTPRMSREQKAKLNDATIREALIQAISSQGWDSVTASNIAKQSGLSVGAIYSRAETLSELANELWAFQLRDFFASFLESVQDALESQKPEQLIAISAQMEQRRDVFSVVLELAVASLFDDELEEVVGEQFALLLTNTIYDSRHPSRVQSAAITLTIGFLLGQAFARKHHVVALLSQQDASLLCKYWASEDVLLEPTAQLSLTTFRPTDSDDADGSLAILKVIAKRGYKKATVSRMARARGMTPGAIFGGYKSKADLVSHAANSALFTPLEVWEQYAGLMDSGTSPRARALFLREYMSAGYEDYWRIALELARVGEMHAELAPFQTPEDALQRTHLAMALIAAFVPTAWDLPYYGPFLKGTAT